MIARRPLAACLVIVTLGAMHPSGDVLADKRRPANVPPTMEIEVLDPGVDSQGNPAVRVERDGEGGAMIDIPPVILVHRYYYSGDRSFQGPMLPGGPSILVFNHPQTGERCYVPAQMMPGAPRVTYTRHGIEYDYGTHATSLVFGWTGKPSLKYRSGRTWTQKAAAIVHAEELQECAARLAAHCEETCAQSKQVVKGAFVEVGEAAKTATIPVRNTLEIMPLGKRLFSGDLGQRMSEKAAEHERQHAIRAAERKSTRGELDYATNR